MYLYNEKGGIMIKKGFTLLEVLIVIIIIGILAAIALPQYTKTLEKAKSAEAITQLGTFRASMGRRWYDQYAEGGNYSQLSNISNLDVDVPTGGEWSYDITDVTPAAFNISKQKYYFKAVRNGTSNGTWVEMDHNGSIRKSKTLGGSGTSFGY